LRTTGETRGVGKDHSRIIRGRERQLSRRRRSYRAAHWSWSEDIVTWGETLVKRCKREKSRSWRWSIRERPKRHSYKMDISPLERIKGIGGTGVEISRGHINLQVL